MKRNFFIGSSIAVITMVIAFNYSLIFSSDTNNTLKLENVEAAAAWELGDIEKGELRTQFCDDGSSYEACEETNLDNYCETFHDKSCPKKDLCETQGHNWVNGGSYDYCTRCNASRKMDDGDGNGNSNGGNTGGGNKVGAYGLCRVDEHFCEYTGINGIFYTYFCTPCNTRINSQVRRH